MSRDWCNRSGRLYRQTVTLSRTDNSSAGPIALGKKAVFSGRLPRRRARRKHASDRFGLPPSPTLLLCYLALLRACRRLGIPEANCQLTPVTACASRESKVYCTQLCLVRRWGSCHLGSQSCAGHRGTGPIAMNGLCMSWRWQRSSVSGLH